MLAREVGDIGINRHSAQGNWELHDRPSSDVVLAGWQRQIAHYIVICAIDKVILPCKQQHERQYSTWRTHVKRRSADAEMQDHVGGSAVTNLLLCQ